MSRHASSGMKTRFAAPHRSSHDKTAWRKRLAFLVGAAALTAPEFVHAQAVTNTWTNVTGTVWSNTANWFNGIAPPNNGSTTTVLQFNNSLAGTYAASNDLGSTPGPFQLQGIVLNSTSSSGLTVANAASNTLQFAGSAPFVAQSNYGIMTISAAFSLNPSSGDFTINGSGLGAATFSGIISDSGGARQVVINTSPSVLNAQVIAITGNNSAANSGFSGGLRLMSGNLALGLNNAAPGTGPITIEGGSLQFTTAINVSNNVTLTSTMNFIGATAGTFSGVLSGAGGLIHMPTGGGPQLNLTGVNTYTGATTVDFPQVFTPNTPATGTLAIIGASGRIASTTINVRNSGTLQISDTSAAYTGGNPAGRIPDNATINMRAGYVQLSSTSSVSATEAVGTLNLESGHSVITLAPTTGAQANLNFGTLTRGSDRATLFIRGLALGDTPANNVANVGLSNAPTLAGGGAPGTPNASIIPFVFGDRSGVTGAGGTSGAGTVGFVTWDSLAQRIRLLSHTTEYVTGFAGVSGTTNNLLLTASENPTAPVTINSLFVRNSASQTIGIVGDTNTISFAAGNAAALYSTAGMTINTPLQFGSNEAVIFANTTTTINGKISGTGGITKVGSGGSLTLTNTANDFSGTITINGGTLAFSSLSNLGSTTHIVAGGGVVSNSGTHGRTRLNYTGTGSVTLPHDIRIASGLFEPRNSGGTTLTLSGTISGPGGILSNSSGTLILTGTNTYTGPTRLFGGNLVISSDSNLGVGGVVDFGAFATSGLILAGNWTTSRQINTSAPTQLDTGAFNAVMNGPITGDSPINKVGAGKWVINSAGNWTGVGTISAGTFEVNGSLAPSNSAVTIAAGANLAGSGSIYRPVTMTGASTLSPGNSAGTLRMNTLTLNSGNTLLFDVGTSSDLVELGGGFGTITLPTGGSYTLRLGDTTGLAAGNYTLFTYGTRNNSLNPAVTGFPAGLKGSFSFGLTSGVLNVLPLLEYEWAPAGADSDGDGAWTQGGGNWEIGTTPTNYTTTDDNANFGQGGMAGVVTLGNSVSVRRIKFQPVSSGVYEIAQGAGMLNVLEGVEANNADGLISAGIVMTASNTMTVGSGRTLTLSGVVSGTGIGLTKDGPGLLTISTAPTYTGTTTILDGTLDITIPSGTTTQTPSGGGTGALIKRGAGTLAMNGTSSRSGDTSIEAGTIQLNAGGGTFAVGNVTVKSGATLNINGQSNGPFTTASTTPLNNLHVDGGTVRMDVGGTSANDYWVTSLTMTAGTMTGGGTLSDFHLLAGAGGVTTNPSATTALIGLAGRFRLEGTVAKEFNIADGAAEPDLDVTSAILNGAVAGANAVLNKTGAGSMRLNSTASTFVGLNINAGVVSIPVPGALGTGTVAMDGGTLEYTGATGSITKAIPLGSNGGSFNVGAGATTLTLSGVVSGASGSLRKVGPGQLTLTSVNTYGGPTTVAGGTLALSATGSINTSISVAGGSVFNVSAVVGGYNVLSGRKLSGNGVVEGALNIHGTIAPGTSVGQLTTGDQTWAPAGSYDWEIESATGSPGVDWDHLAVSSLNITATSLSKFVVRIFALPGTGGPALDNFDPHSPFSWIIATASGSITGFDITKFSIDTTNFQNNNTNLGGFYMSVSGGELRLNYVPEPSAGLLVVAGAAGLLRRRRNARI